MSSRVKKRLVIKWDGKAELAIEPLTRSGFNKEMEKALVGLPDSFKSFVSSESYDRGHSSGYEETLSIAKSLAHDIRKAIEGMQK